MKKDIFFIALFLVGVFSSALRAQNTGTVTGIVVDAETGETLVGVNVVLDGTIKGTATDIDGRYTIRNIEPGTYTLVVSYLSFSTQKITEVVVGEGSTVTLDVALLPETELLEEIVVTADVVLNNEAGLLRQRQKAISFSDAISAEHISNSGSGDAAGAMAKVTGASIVDGKYVYVRGLGDRYTSTQLNGLELPTSDPDKKSFQLDLLPANLLDNIVTLKTFTPDKPGNFSGGLVDVSTKSIPEHFFVNISVKQGYNTSVSFNDILLGEKSKTDWLGFDSGYRSIPDLVNSIPADEIPNAVEVRNNPGKADTLNALIHSFNSTFLPGTSTAGINQSYSIGFGNRHDLGNRTQLGYSLNYSYGMNYSGYSEGNYGRFELLGQFEESSELSPNMNLEDQQGTQTVDWGVLGTVGLIMGSSGKLNFNYLRTQSGENSGRYLHGYWEQLNQPAEIKELRSFVNQYKQRDLASYQLTGKHNLSGLGNIQIDWNTGYQINGQEQPDTRIVSMDARFLFDEETGALENTLISNGTSQHPRPSRFYRDLEETKWTGTLDVTVPIELPAQTVKLKIGGLYETTDRSFTEKRFEYDQRSAQISTSFYVPQDFDSEEGYLNQLGILGYAENGRPQIGHYLKIATTDRSAYDANQDIYAWYGMFEINLLDPLKLATGVRYETTELNTASRDTTLLDTDRFGKIEVSDVLPSVILIYTLSDKSNLRGAVTRTLARPTFREMTPYISFDFAGDNLFRGNANLERTLITNYDLRWEIYPTPGELFTISGFYKLIENPIERVLRFDISEKAESVQNVEDAIVLGTEFEMRKNLGFLGEVFMPLQLITNLTLVYSQVDIPEAELIQIRETQENPETTRALTGQSPYIVNVDLSYMNPELGLSSNISFNKFGDRLSRISQGSAPDIYERSYSSLNLNINKKLGRFLSVNFSAGNLLNPLVKYSQEFKGQEYIYQQYRNGRTFTFGVKYSI